MEASCDIRIVGAMRAGARMGKGKGSEGRQATARGVAKGEFAGTTGEAGRGGQRRSSEYANTSDAG